MQKKFTSNFIALALALVGALSFPAFSQSKIEKMTTADGEKTLPETRVDDYLKISSLGLALGHTWLYGDYANYGSDGLSWDIYYDYSASHTFDLLVDFHWNGYSNNSGGSETLIGLVPSAKIKFYQFDNFTPFLILGLGFYYPEAQGNGFESNNRVVLGLTYGAGLDLRLNRMFKIGAIFQIHNPFAVNQENGSEFDGSYGKLLLVGFYSF